MKIGFVFDDSLDGTDGVQQHILTLGAWLRTQGHEVHYLVGRSERTDIPHVHSLSRNLRVRFNGNRLSIPLPASRRRIKELLRTEQFDILHVQAPYSPLMAGRVMKLADKRTAIIATFHIAPYSKTVTLATRLLAIWSRSSLKRLRMLISVSPAAAEFARRTYKLDSVVIPNMFNYGQFATAKPLDVYQDDRLTILFLGRLVTRKGCQKLLEAVKRLQADKLPPYRVVICGGGPLDAPLKAYVQEQHLDEIVTFAGRVSEADKPRYFASAQIAVFPSSGGESFGIVLLEAMASGQAAVLGGNNEGYRSVLGPNPSLLFNPIDTVELANVIRSMIVDDEKRRTAARWGQQEAAKYDVSVVGRKITAVYEDVVATNSRNGT